MTCVWSPDSLCLSCHFLFSNTRLQGLQTALVLLVCFLSFESVSFFSSFFFWWSPVSSNLALESLKDLESFESLLFLVISLVLSVQSVLFTHSSASLETSLTILSC